MALFDRVDNPDATDRVGLFAAVRHVCMCFNAKTDAKGEAVKHFGRGRDFIDKECVNVGVEEFRVVRDFKILIKEMFKIREETSGSEFLFAAGVSARCALRKSGFLRAIARTAFQPPECWSQNLDLPGW